MLLPEFATKWIKQHRIGKDSKNIEEMLEGLPILFPHLLGIMLVEGRAN